MTDVRKKRSNDEAPLNKRQELEEALAALRDQETVLTRTIELVQASGNVNNEAKAAAGGHAVPSARPTAEPKDYEVRAKQVHDEQKKRSKKLWADVRRVVNYFRTHKKYAVLYATPVKDSAWGKVPSNWALYCSKVAQPMDFGTILARIGDDESRRQYKTPSEVLAHMHLVSRNAITLNLDENLTASARTLDDLIAEKWRESRIDGAWELEQRRVRAEGQV